MVNRYFEKNEENSHGFQIKEHLVARLGWQRRHSRRVQHRHRFVSQQMLDHKAQSRRVAFTKDQVDRQPERIVAAVQVFRRGSVATSFAPLASNRTFNLPSALGAAGNSAIPPSSLDMRAAADSASSKINTVDFSSGFVSTA